MCAAIVCFYRNFNLSIGPLTCCCALAVLHVGPFLSHGRLREYKPSVKSSSCLCAPIVWTKTACGWELDRGALLRKKWCRILKPCAPPSVTTVPICIALCFMFAAHGGRDLFWMGVGRQRRSAQAQRDAALEHRSVSRSLHGGGAFDAKSNSGRATAWMYGDS